MIWDGLDAFLESVYQIVLFVCSNYNLCMKKCYLCKYYHYWWYSFFHSRCKLTLHFSHLYTVLLRHCLYLQYFEVLFVRRWLEVSTIMLLLVIPNTLRVWTWRFLPYIPKISRTISRTNGSKGMFFPYQFRYILHDFINVVLADHAKKGQHHFWGLTRTR